MADPLVPHWSRLEPLLDLLLDTPPSERPARLAAVSGGDAVLASELARLLDECERAHPLLDRPAVERFPSLFRHREATFPSALADRYRLTRELGRGGMATVFLARDLKHDRDVAVKVMHPDLALGRERFLREIRIVAALRHPHIVPLFDSGDADSALYYVMPYEDGLSLRVRLREGPLPIAEALAVLRDVCDALVYAHQHGIVHRDIKPDNVLLSAQHAVVTDFGIAAAVSEAAAAPPGTATPGVMGTPAYMAPEQLTGDPRMDQRVDIYGLGALAYELLSGRPPVAGPGIRDLAEAHRTGEPELREALRPGVPPAVANVVMRCLARRPEDRWQDAEALREALDRASARTGRPTGWQIAAAAMVLAAAIGGATWALRARPDGSRLLFPDSVPSLTVGILPVAGASTPAELRPLAMELEIQLASALAQVHGIAVRPREVIASAINRDWTLDRIASGHDLDYLIRTELSPRGGDSLIVSLELIERGIRTVRAGSWRWRLPSPAERAALILVRDLSEQLQPMLGARVRELQFEAGTRSARAVQQRRHADQYRLLARQRIGTGDLTGATRALDSAAMLLVESQRLDPDWMTPRIARGALSELRVLLVLNQHGPTARAAIRDAFDAGIAVVDSVLRGNARNPAALALRGRLQWQRIILVESIPLVGAAVDSAERYLRAALAVDPEHARAAADLSQLLFTAREAFPEVARLAAEAYRLDAFMENASALIDRLALSELELGRDSAAAFWCGEGLRRFPDNPAHYGCALEVMAWGARPADADSAWRYYEDVVRRLPAVTSPRSAYGAALAAVLARAPDVSRDSVRAVLSRIRAAIESARDASPALRDRHLALEAAVLFRMGESDSAAERFAQYQRRDPVGARRLALRRILRGYVAPGGPIPAR